MTEQTTPSAPGRILVVDDEEVVHASLRKILSRLGLTVEAVFSAREGLELLESEDYDLVITDLMMPGMSGIELLKALREKGRHFPILMVTGYPTIRTAVQALRLGAMDYIAKPYTRKELLAPVKRALSLEGGEADVVLDQGQDPPSAADLVPGDAVFLPHHAWARYEQDGTFLIGVEASFIKAAGALDYCELPEEGDVIEQGYIAVRLTSSAGDVHGVAMPLSGQVVSLGTEAASTPDRLSSADWLIRIVPSQLSDELELLVKR